MVGAGDEPGTATSGDVLFTQDSPAGRAHVQALEKATIPVAWARSHCELQTGLDRVDLPRPALVMVLPSRQTTLQPSQLATMASWLASEVDGLPGAQAQRSSLEGALNIYCSMRGLSQRQRQ